MANEAENGKHDGACVIYCDAGVEPGDVDAPCLPAAELLAANTASSASVLLAHSALAARLDGPDAPPDHVVIVAMDSEAASTLGPRADLSLAGVADACTRRMILRAACETAIARHALTRSDAEFQELSRIGIGLMRERDRKALLRSIVAQAKGLTHSDGAGLLLTSEDEDGQTWLRPVLHSFDSISPDELDPELRFPVNEHSIIGHATLSKKPMVVADAYELPPGALFELTDSFDVKYGYRRRSMLVVPMIDQLTRVIGILFCMNRKTDPSAMITTKEAADQFVIEYSDREARLAKMLASQAAIAIENVRLYAQLENTFEGFVEASVSAIDLRDPATAGHSLRVAAMSVSLAEALDQRDHGPYKDVHFTVPQMRELYIAALLHDFGKVAVREELLLKSKKLPPALWNRIDARFDLIGRTIQLESCLARVAAERTDPDPDLAERLRELEHRREVVRRANEPTMLDSPTATELVDIAQLTFERPDGTPAPYLTPEELHYLQLPKGTLDARERTEVESHVIATHRYLSNISWPDDMKDMVKYASDHHELLNGEGYPKHLTAKDIPLQTRIITMADVFDALTAADRAYKPALPVDQALDILRKEAAAGRLDADLLDVMTESDSFRTLPTTKWRER